MTGRFGRRAIWPNASAESFDDPLVAAWDAVVLGDQETPGRCDPSDIAVIRRFQAMESIPPPSDAFLADLERHLALLKPQRAAPVIAHTPFPLGSAADMKTLPRRGWRSVVPGGYRRVASLAAVALLAVLLIAGPLVFALTHSGPSEPPAIPAAFLAPPTMETLIRLDYVPPLEDMPSVSKWEQMEFSMFLVDPGATFSTDIPWYTSVDGPLMIVALDGDLIIQPAGPARVFRNGSDSSAESPAGTPVLLKPKDAIAFASSATATGSNPGSEPVSALYGLVGVFDAELANNIVDAHDVTRIDINNEAHLLLPDDGASLSIQHLQLAPLETFAYELGPGWRVLPMYLPLQINDLRVYDGAIDGLSPDILANARYASLQKLKYPEPGPHTLINIGDETVDLYFLIVEPYPKTATPAA